MPTGCDSDSCLQKIKEHFGISPEEDSSQGWIINNEAIFILPMGDPCPCTFLLAASLDESVYQQDPQRRVMNAAACQRDMLLKHNMSLAIPENKQFGILQQMIYPDTPEEACADIEEFLAVMDRISSNIASSASKGE